MSSLFQQLKKYQQTVSQITEQLNETYFNSQNLLKQVQKSQQSIEEMLQTLEDARKQKQLRELTMRNKIARHPSRKPIMVNIVEPKQQISGHEDKEELVHENCNLQLTIHARKLYPVYSPSPTQGPPSHPIPECRLKLLLYHLDKKSQTSYFKFSPLSPNIHRPLQAPKLEPLHLEHTITRSNYQLMRELMEQEKVYIFLETQFKVIVAVCEIGGEGLRGVLGDGQLLMLRFLGIGNKKEMFTMEAWMSFKRVVISPDLVQLLDKMHLKRVVINEGNRSRSPSPTLHRQMANSVLKTGKTHRLTVMNDRPLKFSLPSPYNPYDQIPQNVTITSSHNITTPSITISTSQQNKSTSVSICMIIHTKLQDQSQEGYLQYRHLQDLYKITIKSFKLLHFLSLEKSKLLFKNETDCQKINAIIMLTENVYARPSMMLRILENPIQQKVVANSIVNYYFKSDYGPGEFWVFPGEFREAGVVDRGVNVFFRLSPELQVGKSGQVVIAARSKARHIKTSKSQPQKQQSVTNQPQKLIQYYIEVYIIKYTPLELPQPEISLTLEVSGPGLYTLDMTGILIKNSRYVVESMREDILHVVKCQFKVEGEVVGGGREEMLPVQLRARVVIREEIGLLVHDLTRKVMHVVALVLTQKEYWKNF